MEKWYYNRLGIYIDLRMSVEHLEVMEFRATLSNLCIYKRVNDMIVLYLDDYIIISNSKEDADSIFK